MKHLGIFSDSTAVQSALNSDELVKPYIVLTGQSGSRLVDYNTLTQKFETPLTIMISDTTYPNKAVVVISVPEMATGSIECTVDGRTFTGEILGGRAHIDIVGLEVGEYTIDCYYPGDENYLPANDSISFNVIE
jgi:hypothetical protein